jgi:hypothetical protein
MIILIAFVPAKLAATEHQEIRAPPTCTFTVVGTRDLSASNLSQFKGTAAREAAFAGSSDARLTRPKNPDLYWKNILFQISNMRPK